MCDFVVVVELVLRWKIQVGDKSWEGSAGGRRKGHRGVSCSFRDLLEGEGGMNNISIKFLEEHGNLLSLVGES